jgi:Protein of unknown function (DUF2817)
MMATSPESPLARAESYRAARRGFIAACEKAHIDTVARLHPSKPADNKPLFMDAAALGPRNAATAALVVARGPRGSAVMIELLHSGLVPPWAPPAGTRVVLVHALDPAAFAGVNIKPDWPAAMLGAVATEDLSRVRELAVLPLEDGEELRSALCDSLPKAVLTFLPRADNCAAAEVAIKSFLAR